MIAAPIIRGVYLKQLSANDRRLRVQRFKFNCGESAASWAGMQVARGRYIATMDADLQNDPRDLPAMIEALNRADCVCGTRTRRGKAETTGFELFLHGLPIGCATNSPAKRSAMPVARIVHSSANASPT